MNLPTHFYSIVVVSVSRTGSVLITQNLAKHFDCAILHTHNPLIRVNQNQLVILSLRKKTLDTIVSMILASRTKETIEYSNQAIEPFYVGYDEFETKFWHVQCFQQTVKNRFPEALIVEYEPLMADSKYLFSFFGIDKETSYNLTNRSPYSNKALIENYSECETWFDQLQSQTITQLMLDDFAESMKINWVDP